MASAATRRAMSAAKSLRKFAGHGKTCRRPTVPELALMEEGNKRAAGAFTAPRLCERETLMDELHKLIEKKKYEGFLSERDALVFWRHVEARIDGSSGRWTQRDFEQLTRWQLGLPTTMQFQIVAGPVGARAPKRVEVSPERHTLLRRKYGTFAERRGGGKGKGEGRGARV